MEINAFPLGPLESNGYLLSNGDAAVVIDAGGDPAGMLRDLRVHNRTLRAILLTHLHFDHLYGVAELARTTGAPVWAAPEDAPILETEVGHGGFMGLPDVPPFPWEPLPPGEIELLGQPCQVLATPGHSPGGRSYYFPQAKAVFVGDLLFFRSTGRTDLPGGDQDVLLASVAQRIFTLPPDTAIYPGHGPATDVAAEIAHNPFFSEFAQ